MLHAPVHYDLLTNAARAAAPGARVIGFGSDLTVLKGVGDPRELAIGFGLPNAVGWQGVGHTRMATESAVTAQGSHPFSVGPDQCLVHNGSFSNHMTIKHQLEREGVVFDSENDTEVGARFVAKQLAEGAGLEKALLMLNETFDGFYTLLVSTADSFAVVRDAISWKPAIVAETSQWVAWPRSIAPWRTFRASTTPGCLNPNPKRCTYGTGSDPRGRSRSTCTTSSTREINALLGLARRADASCGSPTRGAPTPSRAGSTPNSRSPSTATSATTARE